MSQPPATVRPEDLPSWMRPRKTTIDWGLVLALAFSAVLITPLVLMSGLPADGNARMVAYRSVAVAEQVRQGVLYWPWTPSFFHAYGSPVFTYLAPIPHYLTGYYYALTESDPAIGVRLVLALGVLAAGSGMYVFARGRWGALSGLLTALMYVTAPPIALTLPYQAGEVGLLLALGLLPWAAWSLDQVQRSGQAWRWLLAVALLSLAALCDLRFTLVMAPLIALIAITCGKGAPRRRLEVAMVLLVTGAITAFFWLPALADRDRINWLGITPEPLSGTITPGDAFAIPPAHDPLLLNPAPSRSIGISVWVMALAGTLGAMLKARVRTLRLDVMGFAIVGLVAFMLAMPLAGNLYLSPLSFQPVLPYHVLLVALFALSILSGQATGLIERVPRRWSASATAIATLTILFPIAPALSSVPLSGDAAPVSTLHMLEDELPGYHSATLREGLLLPAGISTPPDPSPRLIEDWQADRFSRVPRRNLSALSRLDPVQENGLVNTYSLVTDTPISVEIYLLNFSGWNLDLEGSALPLKTTSRGLAQVDLPRFRGTLSVWLDASPAADQGWLIALAGVATAVLWVRLRRWEHEPPIPPPILGRPAALTLAAVLVGWCALLLVGASTPWFKGSSVLVAEIVPLPRFLQGGIDLLGYRLDRLTVRADEVFPVSVYWRASRPLVNNYQSMVELLTPDGRVMSVAANRHAGGMPAIRWLPNRVVKDTFALTVPPGLGPGMYALRIRIGVCDSARLLPCPSIDPATAADEQGRTTSDGVIIPVGIAAQP